MQGAAATILPAAAAVSHVEALVGDCVQLAIDVDVYNDKRKPIVPIQVPLDFTWDVAELR